MAHGAIGWRWVGLNIQWVCHVPAVNPGLGGNAQPWRHCSCVSSCPLSSESLLASGAYTLPKGFLATTGTE